MEITPEELKKKITLALQIIDSYKWLIDAYIVDFYHHNHWKNLPASWISCFQDIPIRHLSELLSFDAKGTTMAVWPLSIIALRSLFNRLAHTRIKSECTTRENTLEKSQIKTVYRQRAALFQKSVKLKKRHEIEQFAVNCFNEIPAYHKTIVDIGSGQGNLARTLAYGFGFQVCCIEQSSTFVETARQKDFELWHRLVKYDPNLEATIVHPVHLHRKVNLTKIDCVEFVQTIKHALNIEKSDATNFGFGLVGLHPCGDLAPSLLRLFLACHECRFIKLVCCCYMKLTTCNTAANNSHNEYGFPLSEFCRQSHVSLTYEAREIACHAIEQYREKLLANYGELKIHAYRATIETIIVRLHPQHRHAGLKGGIKADESTFPEYCQRAVADLGVVIPNEEVHSEETQKCLNRWEQVVKFYTLRLMFAPLVETVILYDRLLFLLEKGTRARVDVLFDPCLSPRNHAITAFK
ncbi:methyltransferase-like protein 25B [Anopheles ziemanni]|uniref:methyltransferase-like protein 25B n=1 Tax=Anopheles coustani TaxID=139045 RepID=UPI00265A4899|nr:methyltransferase-like protein 25B [Anopheles coustani]XP_058178939.1 methyltransferase-like protein 25B [Anopheles ziemanni]